MLRRRGKRTLTPAMLEARDELMQSPPDCPEKYALLNVLRALPRALGVSRNAYLLLLRMVEKTPVESWEMLKTPFIYAHNSTLMSWTGLSLTALRRAVRDLADAKMLVPCDGRNGQRGKRWQGAEGEIQVGFNLSSLRHRWPELLGKLEEEKRRRSQVAFLRDAIADLNENVRRAAETLGNQAAAMEAARIMRLRRSTEQTETLSAYYEGMKALLVALQMQPNPVDKSPENRDLLVQNNAECNPELAPMDAEIGTHYTERKNNQTKEVVVVAPNGRNRIKTMRCAGQADQSELGEGRERSALRGFRGTAMFYLSVCPDLRDLCSTSTPDRDELADAAEQLSGQIGISYQSWRMGCGILGKFEAAVAVIVMATRRDHGESIRHPDAYFRSLVDRGARNTLFLDRSLYALRDIHKVERVDMAPPSSRLPAAKSKGRWGIHT
ncbi:replication initiation protein RepC [Acetobacter sp. LMG 32666]|uniref:replication initiation protein RepC n=1 Tax=Acetobacter sp. LMG 32666 TaxID=2959295 RepID=UPI0030C896FA